MLKISSLHINRLLSVYSDHFIRKGIHYHHFYQKAIMLAALLTFYQLPRL